MQVKKVKNRKKWLAIGAAVLLLGAGAYIIWGKKDAAPKFSSVQVVKGEVRQTVSATGKVEATENLDLRFGTPGQVEVVYVKKGDTVAAGQSLAALNTEKLEAQLKQAQAARDAVQADLDGTAKGASGAQKSVLASVVSGARSALEQAQIASDAARATGVAQIQSAEQGLENAQRAYDNLQKTQGSNTRGAYEDAYNEAVKVIDDVGDALSVNETILGSDNLAGVNLEEARGRQGVAWDSLERAKWNRDAAEGGNLQTETRQLADQALRSLNDANTALGRTQWALQDAGAVEGVNPGLLANQKGQIFQQQILLSGDVQALSARRQALSTQDAGESSALDAARGNMESAAAALQVTRVTAENANVQANAQVVARQSELDRALAQEQQGGEGATAEQLRAKRAQVEQAAAGVELVQKQIEEATLKAPAAGVVTDIKAKAGEITPQVEPFLTMIIPNGFSIKANVSEVDIAKVKIDNEVEITFDALGVDRKFQGRVSQIDPAQTEVNGVVYYQVTTIFQSEVAEIKPGMTANLDILTGVRQEVLKVPLQAIKEKVSGEKYAEVAHADGKLEERQVKTGLRGNTEVEITEGLSEGQSVVTFKEK